MSTPINIVEVPDHEEEVQKKPLAMARVKMVTIDGHNCVREVEEEEVVKDEVVVAEEEDLYSVPETSVESFEKRFPLAIKYGWYLQLESEPSAGNNHYIVSPPPTFDCTCWAMLGGEKKVTWAGMEITVPHHFWDDYVMKFGEWKRHPKCVGPVEEKVVKPSVEPVVEEKVVEKERGVRPLPDFIQKVSPKTSPKSVSVVAPVVPVVEKQSVRDSFRDEVIKETRIGNMKKLAAEVHISGVSKYTLAKIEELRSLILQRV